MSLVSTVSPFSYRTEETVDDEYRFEPCPLLPLNFSATTSNMSGSHSHADVANLGASSSGMANATAMACTHHMVIFGTESGHIYLHAIRDGASPSASSSTTISTSAAPPYPTIEPTLLKAVSIAPAGVPSSAVQAICVSPCQSRLACVTLDGTVHLLQIYYSVAVVGAEEEEEEGNANTSNDHEGGSSVSARLHVTPAGPNTPVMLDVKRIGSPLALSSVSLNVPNPSSTNGDGTHRSPEATPRALNITPRALSARPLTRKFTLIPSGLASTLVWTDSRTLIVGCAKNACLVAVILSRPPFLGNVWIADGVSEPERVKKIINTDSNMMPIATKVVLLSHDPHDASPLLQVQHGTVSAANATAPNQQQVLIVTTELRSSVISLSAAAAIAEMAERETSSEARAGATTSSSSAAGLAISALDFTADALLERAFNTSEPLSSVVLEVDPPLNESMHHNHNNSTNSSGLLGKASSLWKGIKSDFAAMQQQQQQQQQHGAHNNSHPLHGGGGGGASKVSQPLFEAVQIGQKPREEGYFGATTATSLPYVLKPATYNAQGLFDPSPLPESEGAHGAAFLRLPVLQHHLEASASSSSPSLSPIGIKEVSAAQVAASVKIFAARHNQRVFEADPLSGGKVLRTLRYEPREDTNANPFASMEEIPLGLLVGLPSTVGFAEKERKSTKTADASTTPSRKKGGKKASSKKTAAEADEEEGSAYNEKEATTEGQDDCYFVWSEAPTFAAVIKLSGTAGCSCCWAMVTEEPPEEDDEEEVEGAANEPPSELCFDIVSSCSYRYNQYRFVLCSTNKVMIVPILPPPTKALIASSSSSIYNFEVAYVMVKATPQSPRGGAPTAEETLKSPTSAAGTSAALVGGGDGGDDDDEAEAGKKKKKKVVVVKKVVKRKGGVVVETSTSRLLSPRDRANTMAAAVSDENGSSPMPLTTASDSQIDSMVDDCESNYTSAPASFVSQGLMGKAVATATTTDSGEEKTPLVAAEEVVTQTAQPDDIPSNNLTHQPECDVALPLAAAEEDKPHTHARELEDGQSEAAIDTETEQTAAEKHDSSPLTSKPADEETSENAAHAVVDSESNATDALLLVDHVPKPHTNASAERVAAQQVHQDVISAEEHSPDPRKLRDGEAEKEGESTSAHLAPEVVMETEPHGHATKHQHHEVHDVHNTVHPTETAAAAVPTLLLPPWPSDSAATRLYDITDKIFRSYAANSLDSAYHCPLLTNILRRLLPLYEFVAAEYVFPAVRRGASANPRNLATATRCGGDEDGTNAFLMSFSTDMEIEYDNHINKATNTWRRRYVEEQDALRLFGLPTAHRYPFDEAHIASQLGAIISIDGTTTLSTVLEKTGLTSNSSATDNNNGSNNQHSANTAAADESAAHSLHQGRFESSLFNEWLSSLLGASLQWALHTDIDEDPTDPIDGNDFWRFDFERERQAAARAYASNNGYGFPNDPNADPFNQSEWAQQWYLSCGESYVPFHYLIGSEVFNASEGGSGEGSDTSAVLSNALFARSAPSAFMKGSSHSATVLEHQVFSKALLGRSRVVVALRLLRSVRIANIFSSNLAKDLLVIKAQCFGGKEVIPSNGLDDNSDAIENANGRLDYGGGADNNAVDNVNDSVVTVEGTPERALARRKCETLLLNALLGNLRSSASDLLDTLANAFPSLVGSGLLEPAGRKMLEKVDEYLQRMLQTVGMRSDVDDDDASKSGKNNNNTADASDRVADHTAGLFVPVVEGGDLSNIGDDEQEVLLDKNGKPRRPSHPASAGMRVLKAAMDRLEILLRPMRMDMIQREVLVVEDLTTQVAGEMDLLRHLITCGALDDEELEIRGATIQNDYASHDDLTNIGGGGGGAHAAAAGGNGTLPGEEAPFYLAHTADWCYSYWASQCKRIDESFRALCDPLLTALDVPRMAETVILGERQRNAHLSASSSKKKNISNSKRNSDLAEDGSEVTAARHLGSSVHPQSSLTEGSMSLAWAKDVLAVLSWHLSSLHRCPPFPVMNANFDLGEWFREQQRIVDEMTLLNQQKQKRSRFSVRKFQLVTNPVALALLNRDANAVVELLSCAQQETPEFSSASAYKRDWVFASRPRSMSVAEGDAVKSQTQFHNQNSQSANHFSRYESQRKDAIMSFNHASVPQLLHYLPYLSVAFPSKILPLILDAFPAISARALYPALASRNRRLRPSNAVFASQQYNSSNAIDHNEGRYPLGGSPMRYDSHQAAAAVMNYWLLKAEHEEEVVADAEQKRIAAEKKKLHQQQHIASASSPAGSPTLTSMRSGRSVGRRGPTRDTSSLLKLITSTTPFETQTKQDLLDDLCQCVIVVGQQKGPQVMELLTASHLNAYANAACTTAFGATVNNRMGGGGGGGGQKQASYFNNISSTAPNAAQFNKYFQTVVRASIQNINADPTNTDTALRNAMRVLEAAARFLVSFASSRSYWATGASTKWSPLTVLSAALERRKLLLEELGDERDALETLLANVSSSSSAAAATTLNVVGTAHGPTESFAHGNHMRNSVMSVGDFGFSGGAGGKNTNAQPSFFGGLLRKSTAKFSFGNRGGGAGGNGGSGGTSSGSTHVAVGDRPTGHLDPVYANIGAFAAAKRAQNSNDPTVRHHYNQLLQTQRKIVRVEDSIMVFLSSASLSLADAYHAQFAASIANNFGNAKSAATPVVSEHQQPVEVLVSAAFYPEVLRLLDVYVFPRAVLDLDLVNCFIEDHAKRRAVGDLLPLFQTDSGFAGIDTRAASAAINNGNNARAPNVNLFSVAGTSTCKLTEQHWLSLLQLSHSNGCLEAAMVITMTVFAQQPKKARYLMRRAFPLLDFPDQLDPDVKRVAAKFAPILGLTV